MNEKHLVSIILSVYNNEATLPSCLDSLCSQTYKKLEIIAVDDKSSDNSHSILQSYKKKDKRLRVYKNKKHYGLSICLNRAVKRARGTFVAFMDPSDVSAPSRIKQQLSHLVKEKKLVAVGSQCVFTNERNKRIGKSAFPTDHMSIFRSFLSGLTMQFETMMIHRKRLPKDILKFSNKSYPILYSELFLNIMAYGEVANLPTLLHYRRKLEDFSSKNLPLFISHVKLWLQSIIDYDTRPSLRSLFTPLVKQA